MTRKPRTGEQDIKTPEIHSTPDHFTAQSGVVAKVKKMFRRALMLSVIAHAPVICGSFTDQNNKWEQKSFFDSGINVWDWQNELKEDLKKEQNIDDNEAEKIIAEVEPIILEGMEKARRAIEIRNSERAKNINPDRVKNHKDEIRRKLEAGEQILFRDFIFESEEITMGIEPEIVKNAQKIFFEEMAALEKEKPEVPTREFLRRIVSYSEEKDAEQGGAYETTQASLSVYLDRKGKGLRGNCEARGKYMAMALESLYPERWNDVYMQRTADHIRALFAIGETTYMMEPGIPVLTEHEKAGTIIYKPQTIIEIYAGLEADPIKVEGEVDEEDTKSNLPTMSDTNSEAFPMPKADGRLKMTSRDHSNLYNPNLAPPEVRNMELPKTIKGKKPKEKKKPEIRDQKMDESGEKPEINDENPSQTEFMDISEWQIVTDTDGKIAEVLPIKPRDYSDAEISERIYGNRFHAGEVYLNRQQRSIFNPTPATIKKINLLALDTVVYGDVTLYGQQALNEVFKTKAGEIIFNLKHPHMPMSLEHAFRSLNSAKKYEGEIQIHINRDLKGRSSVIGDEQGLSPDQFKLLMDGKGGLMLNYHQRKNYDEEEVKQVAASGRPYVILEGAVCEGNLEALRHMSKSKGTVLVLKGNTFIRVAFKYPGILENRFVVPIEEYFDKSGGVSYPDLDALKNAYMLDYKTQVTGISMLGKDRLQKYIDLLEKNHTEYFQTRPGTPDNDQETEKALEGLKEEVLKKFRQDMDNVSPIGSIGACLIPESLTEALEMGVKTVTETNERGVTYTQNWSGEITVKDGVKIITDDPNTNKPYHLVRLLNGSILSMGWMNHNDVYVDNAIAGPTQKITVNGGGFSVKDGEEHAYLSINDNGLVAVNYSNSKFIEFKLRERPPKITEVKETGGLMLLIGPKATEVKLMTHNNGTISLSNKAYGSPSIYRLHPLESAYMPVPGDKLRLFLSVDSSVITVNGNSTNARIIRKAGGEWEIEGSNIQLMLESRSIELE